MRGEVTMSSNVAIHPTGTIKAGRLAVAGFLACVLAGSTGCVTALGTQLLPERVITERNERSQSVKIRSEPAGARIVRDGAVLGTAPAALDFAYHSETRETRRRFCWLAFPFGLIDAGIGGLSVYALASQHPWPDDKKAYYVTGLILAPLYALVGSGLAAVRLADACEIKTERVDVPHDHHLVLRSGTWEEPLDLQVPGKTDSVSAVVRGSFAEALDRLAAPGKSDSVSAVVRGLEAFDWDRTKALDSVGAYRAYLAKYPSGKWRKEAEPRMEQLAWQEASQADTVAGYWQYLSDFPKGKWQGQAEAAIPAIFERGPEQILGGTLTDLMLSDRSDYHMRAVTELLRRKASHHLIDVLSTSRTPFAKRSNLVKTLAQLAAPAGPPERVALAREALCAFATGRYVPPSGDHCRDYREAKYVPVTIPPLVRWTLCPSRPGGNPWPEHRSCVRVSRVENVRDIIDEQIASWHAAASKCETEAIAEVRELQRSAAEAGQCATSVEQASPQAER